MTEVRSSWLYSVSAFVIIAVAAVAGLREVALDPIVMADEGMYASLPLQYALGDVPIRDQMNGSLTMFDLVLWPLFEVHPSITLFELRLLGLLMSVGAAASMFAVLRRYAPAPLVALACAAVIFAAKSRHYTPGYNSTGVFFLTLGTCLCLRAALCKSRKRRIAMGFVSGVLTFLAALSYFPIFPVLAVHAAAWIAVWRGRDRFRHEFEALTGLMAAVGTLVVLTIVMMGSYGLIDDWLLNVRLIGESPAHSASPVAKIAEQLPNVGRIVVPTILVGTLLIVAGFAIRGSSFRIVGGFAGFALSAAAVMLTFQFMSEFNLSHNTEHQLATTAVGLSPLLALTVARLRGARSTDNESGSWDFAAPLLLSIGLAYFALLTYASANGVANGRWAMPLLFPAAAVALYRLRVPKTDESGRTVWRRVTSGSAVVGLCVVYFTFTWQHDAEPKMERAEYVQPRLQGLWDDPGWVKEFDNVASILNESLETGDRFLADDKLCIFYFVTSTRPAINAVYTASDLALAVQMRHVQFMLDTGRVPDLVIESALKRHDSRGAPIQDFIRTNYTLVRKTNRFAIYRRTPPDRPLED